MKKLAKLVKELEKDLLICVKCGTCQATCPLFNITRLEGDVARGKLALLDGLIKTVFSNPDKVNEKIFNCLLCGSCAKSCPSNVSIILIFIKARAILTEYSKLSLPKKFIFRFLISKPERFNKLIYYFEKFQFLFFKEDKNNQKTSSLRIMPWFVQDRCFKKLAKIPFNKIQYNKGENFKKSKYKVTLFPGCAIDKIFPLIALDCVKVLNHYDIDVFIPKDLGCCGIPALASGDRKTFNTLLTHNIDMLSCQESDFLITPCATCLSTIKHLWTDLSKDLDHEEKVFLNRLSAKSLDISQFLVNVLNVPDIIKGKTRENISYHDPCHHKQILNIVDEPRQLIKISGQRVVEMEKADSCCGMGGTFNLSHYNESMKIGELKAERIIKTKCSIVATSCPACMIQLSDILCKKNSSIDIKHPIEIYKQALLGGK